MKPNVGTLEMKNKKNYNPKIHHRRSIRLKDYDYSQSGNYFITACCHQMKLRFGEIENGEMILNDLGKIAYDEWAKLPQRYLNIELDVFQIMPNHMHGIIVMNESTVGATLAVAPFIGNASDTAGVNPRAGVNPTAGVNFRAGINPTAGINPRAGVNPAPTVGDIVGAYKSLVANECLEIFKLNDKMMGKLWQRNYYENIISSERSYQNISNYIINNPADWANDKFYL